MKFTKPDSVKDEKVQHEKHKDIIKLEKRIEILEAKVNKDD